MGDKSDGASPIKPFQTLSTRAKADSVSSVTSVEVCVFVFDVLMADGQDMTSLPLQDRRASLMKWFSIQPLHFELATWKITSSTTDLQTFLQESIAYGCEGLMIKKLMAAYKPNDRSGDWRKVKKDYLSDLHDTLDLVPIGAWYGNGRKAGWFSPFLLACYDAETEELQSLCRCMSGFTDEFYAEATKFYSERIVADPKPYYRTNETPSVWFEPCEVWEILGADLTISPAHKGTAHFRP